MATTTATTATTTRAVWQDAVGVPGTVREKAVPTPAELGDRKVLVRVDAWAINPCDQMLQDMPLVTYPLVLGCDVAGTVAAVQPGSAAAARFSVGDRVFGFTANNGFQEHVALEAALTARIPDGDMAFREAAVLGLCSATSAMLLFGRGFLGLDWPRLNAPRNGKSVLVWGGASAVGSNAIQLATAAGYDVLTTCSARNVEYVSALGAVQAFDYNAAGVEQAIASALDQGTCAGILMAAGLKAGNASACKVAAASKQTIPFSTSNFLDTFEDAPENLVLKHVPLADLKPFPECWAESTPATLGGYMVEALAKGLYKAAPPPLVVNRKGLEGIQEAIDLMRVFSAKGAEGIREAIERATGTKGAPITPLKLVVERP